MNIQGIIADIMSYEGVTQIELAKRINVSRQAISQMINSKDMKISTVLTILDALGYTFKIVKGGGLEDDED